MKGRRFGGIVSLIVLAAALQAVVVVVGDQGIIGIPATRVQQSFEELVLACTNWDVDPV